VFAIVRFKRTQSCSILFDSRVDNNIILCVYARGLSSGRAATYSDEQAAAAAAAAAIDQSTSNGRRAGSVPADSLYIMRV